MNMAHDSIAIAHWAEQVNGGGERVAWELARAFDAPLYVSVRNEDIEPDDIEVKQLFDGWTKRFATRGSISHMVANQFGWEIADELREYDVLISSGNEVLSYVPPTEQTWIHYVHHTSRYATDLLPGVYERKDGLLSDSKGHLERVIRKIERQLYSNYADKPDVLVANSDVIKQRIKSYWGRDDTKIIYPPVKTNTYSRQYQPTNEYYLVLSRLDWHKQIGEIIKTFNDRSEKLVIAGDGSERDRLENLADGNIHFAGYVSETKKQHMLSRAKAVVNNALAEDFGLTTVEPLASGTPVIGVREGMTQHLIQDGVNGCVYDRGELDRAIECFEADGVEWSEQEIEAFAEQFSTNRFHDAFNQLVAAESQPLEVQVEW